MNSVERGIRDLLDMVNKQHAELSDLSAEVDRLRGYLRRIAEGNLGDEPWQASYEVIRHVAKEALK